MVMKLSDAMFIASIMPQLISLEWELVGAEDYQFKNWEKENQSVLQ